MLTPPKPKKERGEIKKGPNISTMPDFDELKDFDVPVLLKMGDDISTDEILRAGAEVLPFRSNIPEISKFTLDVVDENFHDRAMEAKDEHGGHVVIAGENYAQGSSREHAAIAPRYLGMKAVIAKSYARIGWQNLINFGIPPLEFMDNGAYDDIDQGDILAVNDIRGAIKNGNEIVVHNKTKDKKYKVKHSFSDRQKEAVLHGGVINRFKARKKAQAS
ncbi:MAG: hypothetical protein U5J63_09925 [Fodinibius sp.]|nr:hypothetical protein [Fodinibius sp.]